MDLETKLRLVIGDLVVKALILETELEKAKAPKAPEAPKADE
jgi:hypothetical protein